MGLSVTRGRMAPQKLKMRIFAICAIGMLLPFLSLVVPQVAHGRVDMVEIGVVLLATLIGTAAVLFGINALLSPNRGSSDECRFAGGEGTVRLEPVAGVDEISQLLRRVNQAAESMQSRLSMLDQAAHRDPLTALRNRRGFFAEVEPLFAARVGGAFAIIDLDRFKSINDRFGHAAGDQVLCEFAARLVSICTGDSVVARWGGEEFVAFFPRTDEAGAQEILASLAASIRTMPIGPAEAQPVTFSAGLVEAGSEPIDRTAERADAALYAAKRAGRAQVLVERDLVGRSVAG